jgi:S-(hydroxymethyl)glutathione dehydrogenase/alcohol dehydrogenase
MPQVLDLAARGVFRPEDVVTRRYRLDQVDEAYSALKRGEIAGRAIIEM